jgi:hypothetical protein
VWEAKATYGDWSFQRSKESSRGSYLGQFNEGHIIMTVERKTDHLHPLYQPLIVHVFCTKAYIIYPIDLHFLVLLEGNKGGTPYSIGLSHAMPLNDGIAYCLGRTYSNQSTFSPALFCVIKVNYPEYQLKKEKHPSVPYLSFDQWLAC